MDALMRREGEMWAIQMDGRTVRVRDSRGMQHLAVLLGRPGIEVHSLELAGAPEAVTSGDAAPLLDDVARAAYKERLTDLASDLDEADAHNDVERSARIQVEIDALIDQLTAATGLGGRDRGATTDAERARVAVRRALKSALDRVADAHPVLGAHLAATVRTGVFCSYVPDPASPVRWLLGDGVAEPTRSPVIERPLVVGRDDERRALRDAQQRGGIVLVSGEPGIGKTTLVRDLEADAALALHGRCDEHLGVSYQPIVEVIRSLVAIDGAAVVAADAGVGAAALSRVVPEIGVSSAPVDASDTERLLLFDAVARVLMRAGERRTALLVVDDLHWAPPPTLALLLHVVRELEGRAGCVVLTYRDTEVGDGLAAFLGAVARLDRVVRMPLDGIDVDAVIELGASADDAKRLVEHTSGNPFFLRSLLDAPLRGSLPVSVLDVVGDRLRRLSPTARRLLQLAAVAGDRMPARVATTLAGGVDPIDEVLTAGLLVEDGAAVAFSHALVRRAIREQASGVRLASLHAEVGEVLEAAAAPPSELAFHFAAAGDGDRAVRYAITATSTALRSMAQEEAVVHAERGLAFAPNASRERGELLLLLGEAHHSCGDVPDARRALGEAADIAETLGDHSLLADIAIERADRGAQVGQHDPEVAAALTRAIELLDDRDPTRRARLLARLAVEHSGAGRADDARRIAEDAVRIAREIDDEAVLLHALRAEAQVFDAPEHLDRRRVCCAEIDERARARGDINMQIVAAGMRFTIATELGDRATIDAALDEVHRLAQLTRVPRHQWYDLELQVVRSVIDGDLTAAEQHADREYGVGAAASVPNAWRGYALQLLVIRHEEGRAGELADIALEMAQAESYAPGTSTMAALACESAGRTEDAMALLARVDLDALPRDTLTLGILCTSAELALAHGNPARAAVVDALLQPFAGRMCSVALGTICIGPVDRYLSITARVLGDHARAHRHLRDAIALDERANARRWLRRDRDELAALPAVANN